MNRRIIYYYTDMLPFLARGQAAIEKLERNLALFRDASEEIGLIWHPYSKTEEYLRRNGSPVLDAYLEILECYRREGWGILEETGDLSEVRRSLLSCSGYYGDVSDLVYEAQTAGIPVMLQDIDI